MVNQGLDKLSITEEFPENIPGIKSVNQAAFGRFDEANLVDQLRKTSPLFISLVAKIAEHVVGHILFTPVTYVQPDGFSLEGLGLAPLAVLPEFQGKGVGTALCWAGLKKSKAKGYPFIVVLGHPGYYSRFGFEPASKYNITCAFDGIPDDAFMIRIVKQGMPTNLSGVVHYRQEFFDVT